MLIKVHNFLWDLGNLLTVSCSQNKTNHKFHCVHFQHGVNIPVAQGEMRIEQWKMGTQQGYSPEWKTSYSSTSHTSGIWGSDGNIWAPKSLALSLQSYAEPLETVPFCAYTFPTLISQGSVISSIMDSLLLLRIYIQCSSMGSQVSSQLRSLNNISLL